MTAESDREAWWLAEVRRQPKLYALPAYDWRIPPERVAALFARWERDEQAATAPTDLCRRCGVLIKFPERRGQQLHWWCTPAGYQTSKGA